MVEQAFRLIFGYDGFHIRSQPLRIVGTAVKPNHKQVAVAGTNFRHHLLAQALVPSLAVACKLTVALGLEVVNAQQRVPADADIDAWLDAILAAGIYKVAYHVALAVAPFHRLQAIGIHVALPQAEARFMRSGKHGKFRSGCLGSLYPLVRVKLRGIEDIVILHRIDAVISLTVHQPIEDMEVVMEHNAHLRLVPLQLMGGRHRVKISLRIGRHDHQQTTKYTYQFLHNHSFSIKFISFIPIVLYHFGLHINPCSI